MTSQSKHPYVYNPEQAAERTLEVIQRKSETAHLHVSTPLPGFNGLLNDWGAGDMIGILGFTSHGKTTLLNFLMHELAFRIMYEKNKNPDYHHAVLLVNYENPIEELTARRFALYTKLDVSKILSGKLTKEELETIRNEGVPRVKAVPLWLIGSSILQSDRLRVRPPIEDVTEAIAWIEAQGVILDIIAVDYLQLMPKPAGMTMREGFVYNVGKVKDLAIRGPVILSSQAKRETQNYDLPIPQITDAMETNSFESSCQVVFAVWRPWLNSPDKEKHTSIAGARYQHTENLLIVRLLKQTLGKAPLTAAYNIDFTTGLLAPISVSKDKKSANATSIVKSYLEERWTG